ncbi:MAG: glucokinase [Mariprofundus sp.]|nr:glucokinase [Mariprofundus sp.]
MTILAGDIGGTKTLLQLADIEEGSRYDVIFEKRYISAEWDDLTPMVQDFMQAAAASLGNTEVQAACFGIAGPVDGRNARTTNLPWRLNADAMQRDLGIAKVRLINDFQSVGYGIEVLADDDVVVLNAGRDVAHATRVITGAGTGLGQGLLVWQGEHYEVVASEGGHADFAPTDAEQIKLLQHMQQQFKRCSWERVVSGTGISNIHNYMLAAYPDEETAELKQARSEGDSSAAISIAAGEARDPLAKRSMDLFCTLYGAQAGNLALTGLASGGVYVAGGVAPRIIEMLKNGLFMAGFMNKEERMQDILAAMPVRVVVNSKVGLMGSAVAASRL